MLIFQLLTYFSISRNEINAIPQTKKSFSFSIDSNVKITLINASHYLKNFKNDQKDWYYVHFLINDLDDISKLIKIESTDMILKNTFLLYLSQKQLSLISNVSLAKKLEPEEKFKEESGPLEQANYLLVFGHENFELKENFKKYKIESKRSSNSYLISFIENSFEDKNIAVRTLLENPSVKSVLTYSKPVVKNNLMTGFTQKNTHKFSKDEKSGILYIERYLNEKGIDGKGEVVTVVDTLVDFHQAMFNDDNATFDVNQPLNHRKFAYYGYLGSVDDLEQEIDENEHGTHVAGTIAGESSCDPDNKGLSLFNGNAPKAKLIYLPMMLLTTDEEASLMDNFKSRISSNSWDYNGFSDTGNFEYGKASHDNPQLMYLFAAGNEYSYGNFTVDDPSGSKNVVSVGAIDDILNTKHTSRFQLLNDESIFCDTEQLIVYDPFYTGFLGTDMNNSDIVVINAEETNDCEIFNNKRIFLAYASSREKADWIQNCTLYYTNGVYLTTELEKVQLLIDYSKKSEVIIFDNTPINESKPYQHSSFSSSGPANKGAMKPDIMAPGTRILSAKSFSGSHSYHGCRENGTSDVTLMDGTSQATPNAAGASALIRQYFEFGNWTIQSKPTTVDLDGATTRALLINSCVHPQNSKTTDVLYGHGVVDLSTILPFDDEFGVQMTNRYTEPDHSSINEYGHKVAKLAIKSNQKKLQVTLSYLDSMLSPSTPILLTHDLDLVVVSPSGTIYKGDHIETGDTQHLSTNEKVIIEKEEIEIGLYEIHIFSGAFIDSGLSNDQIEQNFSVVASGGIENGFLIFDDAQSCIGCKECDPDHPLLCKCDESSIGAICQAKVYTKKSEKFSMTLDAHEIRRIHIKELNFMFKKNSIKSIEVGVIDDDYGYSNVWIDRNCHLEIGEYETMLGNFRVNKTVKADVEYGSSSLCIAIFNNHYNQIRFDVSVSHKLSMKYVAYIGAGCIAAIILIIIVVVVFVTRSKKKKNAIVNGTPLLNTVN